MAGTQKILASFTNIDATTTLVIDGSGGHSGATFWLNLTAITRTTGTLNVAVGWSPAPSAAPTPVLPVVTTLTGLTAAGLTRMVLTADFNADQMAIPEPNVVTLTLVGDTADVAGEIIAAYGD